MSVSVCKERKAEFLMGTGGTRLKLITGSKGGGKPSVLESNAIQLRMNDVSPAANAPRDTPILRQCVITEMLV